MTQQEQPLETIVTEPDVVPKPKLLIEGKDKPKLQQTYLQQPYEQFPEMPDNYV